ncbi:MAG: polysaccharide export protein [Acidobacteria bacterium]|nr:polysaccharide export protein [Acidobacteriota bacterium]
MISVLLSVLLLASAQSAVPQPRGDAYIVGPKDVLSVSVVGVEALTKPSITVDADGTFDFPYVGRVQAAGLSVRGIEESLVTRLSKGGLILNPQVTVTVEKYRSQSVYVLGAVQEPGQITLEGNASIMSAIAKAGSMTRDAGSFVLVNRRKAGQVGDGPVTDGAGPQTEQIRISRKDLELGVVRDFLLQDGDTLVVPKAQVFFVTGYVKSPGQYVMEDDNLTVLQAISMAGGPTERAAANRTKVQRVVNGKRLELKVKMSDVVQANDTIVVPQRFL